MPLTTPLQLARNDAPCTNWTINTKRVDEIHFFDPYGEGDLFCYPHGYIKIFHGEEITAIAGVHAVVERQQADFSLTEHFMLPPIDAEGGWRLFLALPLIAGRWEVQTKTPKEGWGDTTQSFHQLQMYDVAFHSRDGAQEGHLYLQGETLPHR